LFQKKQKMIKKIFVVLIAMIMASASDAQYYYTDIVSNKQVMAEIALLKEKNIKAVKVTSFEPTGEESEGFICRKKINRDFTEVEIYTATNESYPTSFVSYFDKSGLLQKTIDTSEAGATTINYRYDAERRLVSMNSSKHFATEDDAGIVTEQHLYQYNTTGILEKMSLIKNNLDTTQYIFEADEDGNIIIEKNSRTSEVYYYYYDTKNQLTEIVHRYSYQKTLFTESSFEYNNMGQVTKMISSEKEGAYYFTWRYNYEDGLRATERCYSKEGRMMGSVEYLYKK